MGGGGGRSVGGRERKVGCWVYINLFCVFFFFLCVLTRSFFKKKKDKKKIYIFFAEIDF